MNREKMPLYSYNSDIPGFLSSFHLMMTRSIADIAARIAKKGPGQEFIYRSNFEKSALFRKRRHRPAPPSRHANTQQDQHQGAQRRGGGDLAENRPVPGSYVLFVNSYPTSHKNHARLVEVWARLIEKLCRGPIPRLLIAGGVNRACLARRDAAIDRSKLFSWGQSATMRRKFVMRTAGGSRMP